MHTSYHYFRKITRFCLSSLFVGLLVYSSGEQQFIMVVKAKEA